MILIQNSVFYPGTLILSYTATNVHTEWIIHAISIFIVQAYHTKPPNDSFYIKPYG